MSYTNDPKPFSEANVTWAGILTTWASETRTWAEYSVYAAYTNDSKPS